MFEGIFYSNFRATHSGIIYKIFGYVIWVIESFCQLPSIISAPMCYCFTFHQSWMTTCAKGEGDVRPRRDHFTVEARAVIFKTTQVLRLACAHPSSISHSRELFIMLVLYINSLVVVNVRSEICMEQTCRSSFEPLA